MDSNRQLSIKDIFGSQLTIVIPDMQRDYCWGGKKALEFVSGIVMLYRRGKEASLGLVYGYENPPGEGYLNIIDGQQRLTTLYLLLGMLYRRVPSQWLRRLLISDYKLIDDREPRMIYQVRRESQYFLSDLVTQFFLDRNGRLSQLEKSEWYHQKYDADPTAQNFIAAIRDIDQVLEKAIDKFDDWDFENFARFVVDDLHFLYCDLDTRAYAEDMFVTINTTGQPLSFAQNLRLFSLALAQRKEHACSLDIAERWNIIEDWFWTHDKSENNDRVDQNIERLAVLYLKSRGISQTELLKELTLETFNDFYSFFEAFASVAEAIGFDNALYGQAATLLPCIAMVQRFGTEASQHDIYRLWHLMVNNTRYQKPSTAGYDIPIAMSIAKLLPTPDVISALKAKGMPDRFFNNEELAKLRLIKAYMRQRQRVEQLIARAEDHPMLNGRILPIIEWCTDKDTGQVDIDRFASYIDSIYDIWGTDIDCNPELDPVRIALLTLRHHAYPIVRRGNSVLSLCWRDYDWQKLMSIAPDTIRRLIDRKSDMTLQEMASRFSDKSYQYYFLIKSPTTIAVALNRQLLRPSKPFLGIRSQSPEGQNIAYWWVEQQAINMRDRDWTPLRSYGNRCLYTDSTTCDLAIDLYFTPQQKTLFRIEFFRREGCGRPEADIYASLDRFPGVFQYDRRKKRHFATFTNSRSALALLSELLRING